MKDNYVEDFVNPKYYVNLDFDKLISHVEVEETEHSSSILKLLVAILMFIVMLICLINFWWIALAFSAILAFFSFPKTSQWLQNSMKVVFPNKFFWLVALCLMAGTFISIGFHKYADDVNATKAAASAEQQRQAEIAEKMEQERIAREREQQRMDSLSNHLKKAQTLFDEKKHMEAVLEYKLALPFADSSTNGTLNYKIASILFVQKQYEEALNYYSKASNKYTLLDTLRYNKAVCFLKMGNVASAVNELRLSKTTPRVKALFNKINPIKTKFVYVEEPVKKKRVSYYTILCRDGSHSHSSSRKGTCSRHGGVADWEHPVYETYTGNQRKKVAEKYREYGEW